MYFYVNKEINFFAKKALDSNLTYSAEIYRIARENTSFQEIYPIIDKNDALYGKDSSKRISYDKQIMFLLNQLLLKCDIYFPLQYKNRKEIVSHILGYRRIIDYMNSKYSINDENYYEYYDKIINYNIIKPFYDNLRYNYDLFKDILKERKINIKKININIFRDQNKIIKLLSDFSFANTSNDIVWLFDDIESKILAVKGRTYRQRKSPEQLEQGVIDTNQKHMKKIIEEYNNKKDYIKYFNTIEKRI